MKALVFGTFDVIHPGHLSFLRQAHGKDNYVVASIARDRFVETFKGRRPLHSEEERLASILETGLVDEAYLSDEELGTYSVISRIRPDIIYFGHDQELLRDNLREWLKQNGIDIPTRTLKAFKPDIYKSSKILTSRSR